MHQQPNALRCSEQCRKKFHNRKNHRKTNEREKRKTAERNKLPQTCQRCGCSYVRNRQTKYCSKECMTTKSSEQRNKLKRCQDCHIVIENGIRCAMCRRPRIIPKCAICAECKLSFVVGTRRRFCSEKCYKRYDSRIWTSKHRRRARHYGVDYDSSVTLQKALEHFGRICYLCDELIMGRADSRDPEQAVLEHIIPMAAGGTHTWNNVNVAHRRCNDIKARTYDRKLILFSKYA